MFALKYTSFFEEIDFTGFFVFSPFRDIVYPVTKEKETIFETSSINCHLEKITKYYDSETREFKSQSKISFIVRIISPKLDEIAKDRRVESGIEDSDEEMI